MAGQNNMKGLAKDTAIYGLSSIIGKFLNWMLVPLYTHVLETQADYGIVTHLYAWTALLLVILTYGMETGYFRFTNREDENPTAVYSTALIALFTTSLIFAISCVVLRYPIAAWLGYAGHEEFIALMGVVVAIDAFASIPFAYLRYKKRPIKFASVKLVFVFLNIVFNLFFLVVCPYIAHWSCIGSWYDPADGVRYIFWSNILATTLQTLFLLPDITVFRFAAFDFGLLRRMLRYSLPLLVLGVCGIMNQTLDRIIFPYLHPAILSSDSAATAQSELGVYGACFKVAMIMMMFTQAFRYAYEPFVFAKHKDRQSVAAYADAMKYYIVFSYLILMGMIAYLDLLKYIIAPSFWEGLRIVPLVLWAYIFQGVYFNLSFWYKLTDRTQWGMYFSILGVIITFVLQVVLVPHIGYIASAGSSTVCFFLLMLLSWWIGRRYLPVPYDYRSIGMYTLLVVVLSGVYYFVRAMLIHYGLFNEWVMMGIGTILLMVYMAILIRKDLKQLLMHKTI